MRKLVFRGFTLIELLVVISIIALLAAIILASLNTARVKARDTRRVADIKQIQLALSLYYNDNGFYPQNIYDTSSPDPHLSPTYITTVPVDPLTSNRYAYLALGSAACNATATSYHLGALLEQSTNSALASDAGYCDAVSGKCGGSGSPDAKCTGSNLPNNSATDLGIPPANYVDGANGFSGTVPVYDVMP